MGSTNYKTSTIKSIDENGTWSNGQQTFTKYIVHLENGDAPNFSAIGKFKKNVGDQIYYTLDEKKNYGKLIQTPPDAKPNGQSGSTGSGMTQQESIARSVGVNKAIDLVSTKIWQEADLEQKRIILTDVKDVSIYLYKTLITKPE